MTGRAEARYVPLPRNQPSPTARNSPSSPREPRGPCPRDTRVLAEVAAAGAGGREEQASRGEGDVPRGCETYKNTVTVLHRAYDRSLEARMRR